MEVWGICEECGKRFKKKKDWQRFCSPLCRNKFKAGTWQLGKRARAEARKLNGNQSD